MDPYLERHLRLADHRQLFQGRNLSRVQALGLEMLLVDRERIKVRDFVERFKLALVANDPGTWVKQMFPEWVSDRPGGKSVEYIKEVSDHDLMDPEGGEWRFEQKVTPEEAEKILAEMTQNPQGSFGMDEMDEDEGWV